MVAGQVNQLIAPVKGAILQYQGNIVFAGGQAGIFFFFVAPEWNIGSFCKLF